MHAHVGVPRPSQHRLQHALRDYLLRRTKERYASELPPKTNYVVYCELTDEQRAVYRRVLASKDVQNVLGHKKQGIAKLCACGSGSVTAACCGRGPVWKRVHRPGGRHNGRACKRCPVTCIGLACIDLVRLCVVVDTPGGGCLRYCVVLTPAARFNSCVR